MLLFAQKVDSKNDIVWYMHACLTLNDIESLEFVPSSIFRSILWTKNLSFKK